MNYSVVIRTLGKAGEAYQKTLNSLAQQTIQPKAIVVYIAEGYPLPKETIGSEQYVYVKKGMVAQRALRYDEVTTEYILFLDDDVYLPPTAVETLYKELVEHNGDVISPCVFYNHKASVKSKIIRSLTAKEVCRLFGNRWAYKVHRTTGFSYLNNPAKPVYESQTNAGPCFFCKKGDFLKINYEDEMWLDKTPYALPDDQVMFYKMHLCGLRVLTSFDSGIVHLDAGSATANSEDRLANLIYSEYRNKLIFWYKFIYRYEKSAVKKMWAVACLLYSYGVQMTKYALHYLFGKKNIAKAFFSGISDAILFIKKQDYV